MKFFLFLLIFSSLYAHQLRENYLNVDYNNTTQTMQIELEIETRLLENEQLMDDNTNGIISFKELYKHKNILYTYTKKHFKLFYDKKTLSLHGASLTFHRYQDQTYMLLVKKFNPIDINKVTLHYSMFFEYEKNHKLLITFNGDKTSTILDNSIQLYNFSSLQTTSLQRLLLFIHNGITHILDGFDHLLFVLMILFPIFITVHLHTKSNKNVAIDILKIVTTFSLAHSITLFISGAGLYTPNVKFIEVSIALSILIVASLNFMGDYSHVNKKIVFGFGLLHGFGFANVLEIAHINNTFAFVTALFGFNLGVEIGQLFVILLYLLILYPLSTTRYALITVKISSFLTVLVSSYWIIQRVGLV